MKPSEHVAVGPENIDLDGGLLGTNSGATPSSYQIWDGNLTVSSSSDPHSNLDLHCKFLSPTYKCPCYIPCAKEYVTFLEVANLDRSQKPLTLRLPLAG